MNPPLLRVAVRCVRTWTWLYTWRMPQPSRERRRAEIESDLWEFQHDRSARRGRWSAFHVLVRLLFGVPADLLWRAEHMRVRPRSPRRTISLLAALVIAMWWITQSLQSLSLPPVNAPSIDRSFVVYPPPPPPPPARRTSLFGARQPSSAPTR